MIRPMFNLKAKPKQFNLPLRYYDPKEDERRRRRIRIKPNRRRPDRGQGLRIMIYAAGLALVIYIMSIL